MAEKVITGDLNVTGAYKQNGTALESGTKWYHHVLEFTNFPSNVYVETKVMNLSDGTEAVSHGTETPPSGAGKSLAIYTTSSNAISDPTNINGLHVLGKAMFEVSFYDAKSVGSYKEANVVAGYVLTTESIECTNTTKTITTRYWVIPGSYRDNVFPL